MEYKFRKPAPSANTFRSNATSSAQGAALRGAASAPARPSTMSRSRSAPLGPTAAPSRFTFAAEHASGISPPVQAALRLCGGTPVSNPSEAHVLFLDRRTSGKMLESPAHPGAINVSTNAKVAYLTGEHHLVDHSLRHELLQTWVEHAEKEDAEMIQPLLTTVHTALLSGDQKGTYLQRPRYGPVGPRCAVRPTPETMYQPYSVFVSLPDDLFKWRGKFTLLRATVLVTGRGEVYVGPDCEANLA